MKKGKLWRVSGSFPHVLLPIFIIEQNEPDDSVKQRRILNCIHIYHLVPYHKFELPTPELTANLLSGFVFSIDLRSAYFQKNLVHYDSKFFRFRYPKTNK